jgi:hypothetical protein
VPFKTPLNLQFVDGKHYLLTSPLVYETHAGDTIEVPAWFLTDFASIPELVQPIIGEPEGPYGPAAVVHDFLYRTGLVPRAEADRIFREGMEDLGIRSSKRWLMWSQVRMWGWTAYLRSPTGAETESD